MGYLYWVHSPCVIVVLYAISSCDHNRIWQDQVEHIGKLTHWLPKYAVVFSNICNEWHLEKFLGKCPHLNANRRYWWEVNIGSGNGLVPSGTKPLPEPMLAHIYVIIGHNELQDRRWNADKPSAALDPYIPTWLTTSPANHRPANFWIFFLNIGRKLWKVVQSQVELMKTNSKFEAPILWFFRYK